MKPSLRLLAALLVVSDAANDGSDACGMINSSIPTTTLGDSPKQIIGKTPIGLVERGVARTDKLDLTVY